MQYVDIVAKVRQREGLSEQRADSITKATVAALAELTPPSVELRRLAEQFPVELKRVVQAAAPEQQRSLEDFVLRVSELSGVDIVQAHAAIRTVLATLAEAVNHPFEDLFAELPPDFADLMPTPEPRITIEEFLERVQDAAGIDSRDQTEQAVHATLRTLADRISGGQAKDLALYLPAPVRADLIETTEQAEPFDRDEFLDRVAAIESTDRTTAERHARAVLTAVRVSVPESEVADTLDQLPSDIARLTR